MTGAISLLWVRLQKQSPARRNFASEGDVATPIPNQEIRNGQPPTPRNVQIFLESEIRARGKGGIIQVLFSLLSDLQACRHDSPKVSSTARGLDAGAAKAEEEHTLADRVPENHDS
ncbi:hypothetical protein FZEAL_10713 [Fusarium zealandicum]|uniref:Uncharacterized protein n=1 Tax=Fusarium zealandicum TaxID=1053134 RepID=A0A8H4TXI1_9HYPO|nr:hypothetical protein FZEAL_10713 [Fusarium zealandicum]